MKITLNVILIQFVTCTRWDGMILEEKCQQGMTLRRYQTHFLFNVCKWKSILPASNINFKES